MKVRAEIKGLNELKKRMLQADLVHTRFILLDELHKTAEKMKGNRGLHFKIVHLLSRVSTMSKLTVDSFAQGLETASNLDVNLFDFEFRDQGEIVILDITMNDYYFDLLTMVPAIGGMLGKIAQGRKKFLSEIEKTIRDDYSKDYKIYEV